MYYDTIEKEHALLMSLFDSQNRSEKAKSHVAVVSPCPKCKKGDIETHCTTRNKKGHTSWSFRHYCNSCGEEFELGRIGTDIMKHKPFSMLEKIETPFGDITVMRNGNPIPFKCRYDSYTDSDENLSTEQPLPIRRIDIDVSDFSVGDFIFCGFDHDLLEFEDSDERCVLHLAQNDDQVLGFCFYEPYPDVPYKRCCYEWAYGEPDGVGYLITEDPQAFDEYEYYESKIITIAVAWLQKSDCFNPSELLFFALT